MKPGSGRVMINAVLGWGFAVPAALVGIVVTRKLHMSNLSAAWVTFGCFGLAGGAGFVLAMRAAGARASIAHAMTLAGIWTPCLVASVIPMFFTTGVPVKMAVWSLFFFTLFGGLGGLATAWIFEAVFPDRPNRDLVPAASCWGIGFGLAALSAGLIGAVSSKFFPGFFSWVIGLAAMAAMAGIAGGAALLVFLRGSADDGGGQRPGERLRIAAPGGRLGLWTVLLLLPFFANDLADIFVRDWRIWLFVDYTAVKLWPLLVLAWLIHTDSVSPEALGISGTRPLRFAAVLYVALLFGTIIDQNAMFLIGRVPGHPRLGSMPEIASPFWARIDLTLGLMLVAVCEELVFRGYLCTLLRRYTKSALAVVLISAAVFGLIHWSGGIHRVLATGLIGAVFMMLYLRVRSVHPLILAHFFINFIDFSGLVPTDLLRYL